MRAVRHPVARSVVAVAVALCVAAVACGGRVGTDGDGGSEPTASSSGPVGGSSGTTAGSSSGGTAGSSSGSTAGSSSGTVTVPPCPTEPPIVGTTCTGPGEEGCVYVGGSGCHSFVCDPNGVWQASSRGC